MNPPMTVGGGGVTFPGGTTVPGPLIDGIGRGLGGLLGGIIGGLLGGPPGAAIGRGIGSRYGDDALRGGLGALAQAMNSANEEVETETTEQEATKTCADCGDVDCFNPPEGSTPEEIEEFRKQLEQQQNGINNMSPDQLIRNMDAYDAAGRAAGDAAARRLARSEFIANLAEQLFERYSQTMPMAEARSRAQAEARSSASSLDVLHSPDLAAGGTPGGTTGLGGRSANRSIGAQWNTRGAGSELTRREQLRQNARNAKDQGANKMNVDLEMCPQDGDDAGAADQPTGGQQPADTGTGDPGPGDVPMS